LPGVSWETWRWYYRREQQPLRMVEIWRTAAIVARSDRPHPLHRKPRSGRQQHQLARCEAGGPQVELTDFARLIANLSPLVVDAGRGVKVIAVVQVADREVGREGTDRNLPPRPHRPGHFGEHQAVIVATQQAESTLTEGDGRVETRRPHRQATR